MKPRLWIILLAGMCIRTAGLHAQENLAYAVDTQKSLYQVDLTTATTTFIGTNAYLFLEGLALSPTGQLFGTDVSGNLYRVNKTNGVTTLIGNTRLGDIEALRFMGKTLLAFPNTGGTGKIYSLDTSTAKATAVVTTKFVLGGIHAMAIAADKSILISASLDRSGQLTYHSLYSIDLASGNVTFIGNMEVGTNISLAAMDFDSSRQLFGLDQNGNEWIINPTTAAVTLIGNTGGQFWLDMSTGAQPPAPVN